MQFNSFVTWYNGLSYSDTKLFEQKSIQFDYNMYRRYQLVICELASLNIIYNLSKHVTS